MKAVNWNVPEDYVNTFWNQNIAQFWTDEEFPISDDLADWHSLTSAERAVYKRVLAGLTGLDTQQGGEGMPLIAVHTDNNRQAAVMTFMSAMESVHAKSYSSIFSTLITTEDTAYLLDDWSASHPRLTYKAERIGLYYRALLTQRPTVYERYMACVASVFLESFLFYSGFYYPLYQAGQGRMTISGEVIRKIMIDESIHGLFVGMVAQELRAKLTAAERERAEQETEMLLTDLYDNEAEYTREIYDGIGLTADVLRFVEYNANKALMNLGLEPVFNPEPFSAIVANGLSLGTVNHDFFSKKGDGYVMALNIEKMTDADFIFEGRPIVERSI
ncbi:class 1b ribonucleoside-diphosphate reductase subunit beta [Paenibacillus sp. J5C_2022]|uniref:class 1b ribonucleoside-diphosphate reductase subunit beta n=1 Tax=Paenibacillus sp. J5C2022 TaxID=2977129 RepID=UPI0021CF3404|nr:class 1b ribonucleoside-diphosphate reductase subunit beta [Paenibacillus sp. J5C2022]MCU6709320.1 class 1b ribonucleoside-diphosphate reductase subunit beta [Paenibacillus sp. J5C2022]